MYLVPQTHPCLFHWFRYFLLRFLLFPDFQASWSSWIKQFERGAIVVENELANSAFRFSSFLPFHCVSDGLCLSCPNSANRGIDFDEYNPCINGFAGCARPRNSGCLWYGSSVVSKYVSATFHNFFRLIESIAYPPTLTWKETLDDISSLILRSFLYDDGLLAC